MDITLRTITIRELVDGYSNNEEEGVTGYGGRLNIRPPYQREFVYTGKQQEDVIHSVFKRYPLNVMYWVQTGEDQYELLDGQQRTMSICQFHAGEYFVTQEGMPRFIHSLTQEQRQAFLDCPLQVYICQNGTTEERLAWFKIINVGSLKLTDQELRNAVYAGPWVTSAKRRFSKTGCVAAKLGDGFVPGGTLRQELLERVLRWVSGGDIEEYMATHQLDQNSDREWQYFQTVINWAKMLFTTKRAEMKSVEWGELYNRHKDDQYSATELEARVRELMIDDDVTNKRGIYAYVLGDGERHLNIRAFSPKMRSQAYERQKGICPHCRKHYELAEMQADHITPWSKGGGTTADNCQMLCADCNRRKSDH